MNPTTHAASHSAYRLSGLGSGLWISPTHLQLPCLPRASPHSNSPGARRSQGEGGGPRIPSSQQNQALTQRQQAERFWAGTLDESYQLVDGGLVKRSIYFTYQSVKYHVVNYFTIGAAIFGQLTRPRDDPGYGGLVKRSIYFTYQSVKYHVVNYFTMDAAVYGQLTRPGDDPKFAQVAPREELISRLTQTHLRHLLDPIITGAVDHPPADFSTPASATPESTTPESAMPASAAPGSALASVNPAALSAAPIDPAALDHAGSLTLADGPDHAGNLGLGGHLNHAGDLTQLADDDYAGDLDDAAGFNYTVDVAQTSSFFSQVFVPPTLPKGQDDENYWHGNVSYTRFLNS